MQEGSITIQLVIDADQSGSAIKLFQQGHAGNKFVKMYQETAKEQGKNIELKVFCSTQSWESRQLIKDKNGGAYSAMLFDMTKQIDYWKPKYIIEKDKNPQYTDKIGKKQ